MLWNPIDPLGSLSNALQAAVASIVELFKQFVSIPVSLDSNPFVEYLYGSAIGVYGYLSITVVAVTFIIALFFKRGRASFAQALVVVLVVSVLGPLWFKGIDEFELFGNQLTILANLNPQVTTVDGVNVMTLAFPSLKIGDILLSIFTFGPMLYFMHALFSVFVSYAFLAVVVKFLGLICFSLLALGTRSQKVLSLLISIGIVALVIGRPAAVLLISIGQGLSAVTTAFAAGFIQGIILNGSIIAAILIQPVLLFLMYKGVSPIIGKVAAKVTGAVKTLSENRAGSGARALSNANTTSLQGRSQAIPYTKGPSYGRRVVDVGTTMAIAKGAALFAAKAASSVPHPIVKAAAVVGLVTVKALPKGTPKSPRR